MALSMVQFSYKSEMVEKLIKNPEDRSVAVRKLIEKNGGKIWIESVGVPGQGTTVAFTVPVVSQLAGG